MSKTLLADKSCHLFRPMSRRAAGLLGAHQAFAEPIDELAIRLWQVAEKAVDRLDDDAPLRESGDGAERVQPAFELDGYADTELRVVLNLLSVLGACGWTTDATTFSEAIVGHCRRHWRRTAEMR